MVFRVQYRMQISQDAQSCPKGNVGCDCFSRIFCKPDALPDAQLTVSILKAQVNSFILITERGILVCSVICLALCS